MSLANGLRRIPRGLKLFSSERFRELLNWNFERCVRKVKGSERIEVIEERMGIVRLELTEEDPTDQEVDTPYRPDRLVAATPDDPEPRELEQKVDTDEWLTTAPSNNNEQVKFSHIGPYNGSAQVSPPPETFKKGTNAQGKTTLTAYKVDQHGHSYATEGASVTLEGGTDEKTLVSSDDTTPGTLLDKVATPDDWLQLNEQNAGGDETLQILHQGPGPLDSTALAYVPEFNNIAYLSAAGEAKIQFVLLNLNQDAKGHIQNIEQTTANENNALRFSGGPGLFADNSLIGVTYKLDFASDPADGQFFKWDDANSQLVPVDIAESDTHVDVDQDGANLANDIDKLNIKAPLKAVDQGSGVVSLEIDWAGITGYNGSAQQFLAHDTNGDVYWEDTC